MNYQKSKISVQGITIINLETFMDSKNSSDITQSVVDSGSNLIQKSSEVPKPINIHHVVIPNLYEEKKSTTPIEIEKSSQVISSMN